MRREGADVSRYSTEGVKALEWCCRGGLNSRPRPYQGRALPLSYDSLFYTPLLPYQGFKCVKVKHFRVSSTPNDIKYLQFKTSKLLFGCLKSRLRHTKEA